MFGDKIVRTICMENSKSNIVRMTTSIAHLTPEPKDYLETQDLLILLDNRIVFQQASHYNLPN